MLPTALSRELVLHSSTSTRRTFPKDSPPNLYPLSQPQVQHFPGTVLDQASPVQLHNVTSGMALPRDHPGSGDQPQPACQSL